MEGFLVGFFTAALNPFLVLCCGMAGAAAAGEDILRKGRRDRCRCSASVADCWSRQCV